MIPTAHMRYVRRKTIILYKGEPVMLEREPLVLQQLWIKGENLRSSPGDPVESLIKCDHGEWRDIPIVEVEE